MPRGRCTRYVSGEGESPLFVPKGRKLAELAQVRLMPDELEALRLADQLGLYQEEAAARMQVSRPTFSRIVSAARAKVADALVNGKAILLVPLAHAPNVQEDPSIPGDPQPDAFGSPAAGRRVCIPIAVDRGFESTLLDHFGSAPLFAIVDIDTRAMETIVNAAVHARGSCAPVDLLSASRVDAVIAGGIGMGAIRRLAALGIPVYKGHPGPVSRLVEDYRTGALEPCGVTDGCAHHEGTP
ncbi:MAG: DUF134 domain-containing protein [Bacteroidota bacterium]|nr:DUF134 domain-containing protein [Bacteroidota bacterium]